MCPAFGHFVADNKDIEQTFIYLFFLCTIFRVPNLPCVPRYLLLLLYTNMYINLCAFWYCYAKVMYPSRKQSKSFANPLQSNTKMFLLSNRRRHHHTPKFGLMPYFRVSGSGCSPGSTSPIAILFPLSPRIPSFISVFSKMLLLSALDHFALTYIQFPLKFV